MPAIWNISGSNIISNKKLSSKLTFSVGEKFTGKITKKEGSKEVTIKLSDGWQFKAEIDEDIDLSEKTVFKFKVEDLKDGKLKLKIVKENSDGVEAKNKNNILNKFIKSEGLFKEDLPLLKEMMKRDVPLTRENIAKFKDIINFNNEIKENPDEIDNFIDKFLFSKEINKTSSEGVKIESLLKDFINVFKKLSKEDIMFLLENNIELNKENIESFNKLFKEENNINKLIANLNEVIENNELSEEVKTEINKNTSNNNKNFIQKEDLLNKESELNNKSVLNDLEKDINEITEKNIKATLSKNVPLNDTYGSNETKGSMLNILRTIVKGENKEIENIVKDIISSKFENGELSNSEIKLDNITKDVLKKEFIEKVIDKNDNRNFIEKEILSKESVEKTLSKIINKEIKLTVKEYETILKGIIKEVNIESEKNINKKTEVNEKIFESSVLKGKEVEKNIKLKLNNIKGIINLVKNKDGEVKLNDKITQFIKENSSDFKLFNSISKEYYYLDIPVNISEKEYPCKLIIKDNRKDDKKIDKNNFKVVVSIKTNNIGVIDSYIHLNNRTLNILLKCNNDFVILLEKGIENLKKSLEKMEFDIKIYVENKVEEVTISNCRNFFSNKEHNFLDRIV
ncbi:hypothetical protein [uncultured Clostridium sp.]|uniref:hypothetical protein n=1 Tax=uncultured Clostridium sp. TaxID=59620 RepID=UPI00258CE9B4|nr:hypothetical protein [uncultured Clostridium sp.]